MVAGATDGPARAYHTIYRTGRFDGSCAFYLYSFLDSHG